MISPRNVELPPWYGHDFHWGFKLVLSYSKAYTFSTFGEEKNVHLLSKDRMLHVLPFLVIGIFD